MEERIIKDINNLLTQLFQKMKEAGYEWDDEKKKLKKIDEIEELFKNSDVEVDSNKDGLISATIKYKNEQKSAWSEEDERIYQSIIDDTVQENQLDNRQINWLKSLKDRVQPQSQWKPNNEQMTALRRMKAAIAGEGAIYKPLNSLYEDLKKLREE